MSSILNFLGEDHKECDHIFAELEKSVDGSSWEEAEKLWKDFHFRMTSHFRMEEEVFFPAFEQKTGTSQGPTSVMRMEHETMRGVFGRMEQAVLDKNRNAFLGEAEGLLFVMQQHNAKEEQMLYPMGDRVFGQESNELVDSMKASLKV